MLPDRNPHALRHLFPLAQGAQACFFVAISFGGPYAKHLSQDQAQGEVIIAELVELPARGTSHHSRLTIQAPSLKKRMKAVQKEGGSWRWY